MCYFEHRQTQVDVVTSSHDDHMIDTPTTTVLVEPNCLARLTKYGDVKLKVSVCTCVSCDGAVGMTGQ